MVHPVMRRVQGTAITVLILGLSLTACSGKTLRVDGKEVQGFDKSIAALDDAWKQSVTDGVKASISEGDGSRCYGQVNGEVLASKAICGPVHYLGSDETTWDTVSLKTVPGDSLEKIRTEKDSGFYTGQKNDNSTLYRPDGKQPPNNPDIPEPDAETADSGQAIWIQNSGPQAPTGSSTDAEKATMIVTPDAMIMLQAPKVTDRIGGPLDRRKAGDGHKFGSLMLGLADSGSNTGGGKSGPESKTVLAFTAGGKSYNVGKPQSGTLAMSVPGDGKDLALTVTYEGKTQTLSLADGTLDSKSSALTYYDGYDSTSAGSGKVGDLKIEKNNGFDLTFYGTSYTAERLPYDPAVGWAPEGKTWLKISGNPSISGMQWRPDKGYDNGYYTVTQDIALGTVTNVSGEPFTVDLTSHQGQQASGGIFGSSNGVNAIFEVPAKAKDFNASFTLRATGTLRKDQSNSSAPASGTFDSPVKDLQFTFPQDNGKQG
ncbi:hypothetical protein ACLRGI_03200 [Paenarthrobacter nitroguajacolicus]|uniref:hypothetical protein n=1 Tax=Paenarthrobacter nitroguajacolicus TaxID=211146 RepID=UPI003AE28673